MVQAYLKYFKINIMIRKIREFFCKHDYIIMKEFDDDEERNKLVCELKSGEKIAFSRLHKCKKCFKETMIGSGWNC